MPWSSGEEGRLTVAQGRHDKRAIEHVVELLAGSLGDQLATVASAAQQVLGPFRPRVMIGAHRIIRTELAALKRTQEVPVDLAACLDEAA